MARKPLAAIPFLVLLLAPGLRAQQAPLLTLPPRGEQVRQLELRGDVMMIRKRYHEARDVYDQAFKLTPTNAPLANKLGMVYFHLDDFKRATAWYERALKINPEFFEPLNNLGMVQYQRRNYKKARRYFERALEMRPESASAHINLGATYLALKKPEEALPEFRLAFLLDPEVFERRTSFGVPVTFHTRSAEDMAQFYVVVARSFAALGDVNRCLAYLRRALEEGFRELDRLQTEPDFALIREDIRFQQLLAQPPSAIQP